MLPPLTTPCAERLSVSGLKSLASNGVLKLPLDVLEEKLNARLRGRFRVTLPLAVAIDTSPALSEIVARTLPLVDLISADPLSISSSILPLVELTEASP